MKVLMNIKQLFVWKQPFYSKIGIIVWKIWFCFRVVQHIIAFGRRQFDNNDNYDDLGYSDYDYELPQFWEEQFSNVHPSQTGLKHAERKKPPIKGKAQTVKPKSKPRKRISMTTTTKITSTHKFDLNRLFFPSLESYHVLAQPIPESKYPWIAKVVHSRSENYPYVCTAVCIEPRVFLTAARCTATLKVGFTSVIYQKLHFLVKVFISPDNPTKQLYDDVSLIVVYSNIKYKGKWPTVKLFNSRRKGKNYTWFEELNYSERFIQHKAIGYTCEKSVYRYKDPQTQFRLTELPVLIDINICELVFSMGNKQSRYHVPCYHYCNLSTAVTCTGYHGAEGAAVYNFKTNKLLGIATWGLQSATSYELPVGFSVPNSDNFFKDLACMRKIKEDRKEYPPKGYYQSLCK